MPQFQYGDQPRALNGQVADMSPHAIDSYVNEIVAQQSNVAGGAGTALVNEIYTLTATGADGSITVVSTAAQAGGEAATAILTELTTAWNSDPQAAGIGTITDNTGDIDIDYASVGTAYTLTITQTGAGAPTSTVAFTVTTPQAAGGQNVGLAVAVQYGANDEQAAPSGAGMVDADVIGFTTRNLAIQVNETPDGAVVNPEFRPGEMLSVLRQGTFVALVEDAVTKGAQVFVRIANVTAAGDPLGMPRSDADGGDAIALTGCRFGETTTGRGLAKIEVNRPA